MPKPPTKKAQAMARMERWETLDEKLRKVCKRRGLPMIKDPADYFSIHLDADALEALLDELLRK